MASKDKTLGSVEMAIEVIEELKKQGGARVTDLAQDLDCPKATVYYHLNTLRKKQFVSQDEAGKYHLGFRFLELSYFAEKRIELLDSIRKQVDQLAIECGEISLFSVPEQWYSVCVHVARGDDAVELPMFVGRRHPLHTTAVGKALLAHLPEEQTIDLIESHGLDQLTDQTITDPDALLDELATIRERGLAFNRGETLSGLVGVGVPVMNHDDDLVGAISVIGPESRIDEEKLTEEFPKLLEKYANVINLNFTTTPRYSWEGAAPEREPGAK